MSKPAQQLYEISSKVLDIRSELYSLQPNTEEYSTMRDLYVAANISAGALSDILLLLQRHSNKHQEK